MIPRPSASPQSCRPYFVFIFQNGQPFDEGPQPIVWICVLFMVSEEVKTFIYTSLFAFLIWRNMYWNPPQIFLSGVICSYIFKKWVAGVSCIFVPFGHAICIFSSISWIFTLLISSQLCRRSAAGAMPFIYSVLWPLCFISVKSSLRGVLWIFSHMLSSQRFSFLPYIISLIHCSLFLGQFTSSHFILSQVDVQVFKHHLLKSLYFLPNNLRKEESFFSITKAIS